MAAAETSDRGLVALSLDRRELLRVREALTAAGQLLDREETGDDRGPEAVAELIAAIEAQQTEEQASTDEGNRVAHQEQLERLRSRFRLRREAFSRVEGGIGRLREMTSPPAILDAAPRRLCESSDFERVLLSTVADGQMVPAAVCFEDDTEGTTAALQGLADRSIRLEHPLLEAEVLRRRRATGVPDARIHPRVSPELTEVMAWSAFVVAPVVIQGRVIAVLHADRRDGSLDVLHREILWRFAVGLAGAFESASLRRRLRQEREYMRRFLDRLDARLGELSDSAIELAPSSSSAGDASPWRPTAGENGHAFEGVLTRREVEVLSLVAEGLSNRQIADRLVISEGTVKFHVNSILRKLRVANRAEAVSRYLSS